MGMNEKDTMELLKVKDKTILTQRERRAKTNRSDTDEQIRFAIQTKNASEALNELTD